MSTHKISSTDTSGYRQKGLFRLSETQFNLRAFGKRKLDVMPEVSLSGQSARIMKRLYAIIVEGHPVAEVAEQSGVRRQSVYLNIYKFIANTQKKTKAQAAPGEVAAE